MPRTLITRLAVPAVVAMVVAVALAGSSLRDAALEWLQAVGRSAWGPPAVLGTYAVFGVLAIPGSLLSVSVGFLFGLRTGVLLALTGMLLGATAAFVVGRTLARDRVARWLGRYPRFQALDHAVSRQGLKLVLLVRLSPLLPANVLNYLLSMTRISLGRYLLGTALGGAPVAMVYVYVGSALRSLADRAIWNTEAGRTGNLVFVFLGVTATLGACLLLARIVQRTLEEHARPDEPATAEGCE